MGAGKSTAARLLIRALGCSAIAEGSPTFAIAHEYPIGTAAAPLRAIHLDLYRINSDEELAEAGIPAYFWENPDAVVLSEWTSRFPALEQALIDDLGVPLWKVTLGAGPSEELRSVGISRFGTT